jgi:hypothetical protein
MRKGSEIEYRIRWLGLPLHWKTLISQYEPPFLFVDEQTEGTIRALAAPATRFHHLQRAHHLGRERWWEIISSMHCPWAYWDASRTGCW